MYRRDEELREARAKINDLSEELGAARQQTKRDYESSLKTLQREISEVPNSRNLSFSSIYLLTFLRKIMCRYKILHLVKSLI